MLTLKEFKRENTSNWIPKSLSQEIGLDVDPIYEIKDIYKLFVDNKSWFPCLECRGCGGHRHCGYPNEDHGKWKECKKCKGKGTSTEKAFYDKYVEITKQQEETTNRLTASINEKLTDEEKQFMMDGCDGICNNLWNLFKE